MFSKFTEAAQLNPLVNGGENPGQWGGGKPGQLGAIADMRRGPIGPLRMSAAKIFRGLRRRDFPSIGVDGLIGGGVRLFSTSRPRLLEPITLAVHF